MPVDISGGDRVEAVGESFYREALDSLAHDGGSSVHMATLIPDPANQFDRNAVKVMVGEKQVAHLPRDLAALVSAPITELTASGGPVITSAAIVGSGGELGFGVVLSMDLTRLGVAFEDDLEAPFEEEVESVDAPPASDTDDSPKGAVADSRHQTVERAVERWKDDLIDLTARNRLLYMRDLRSGTLSFGESSRAELMRLVSGRRVALSKIIPRSVPPQSPQATATPFEDAVRRMRTIARTARSYEEERGVRTLFLACGVASWRSDRSSRPPAAPVLLVPISVRARGAGMQDFDLELVGELELNPTLLHLLKVEFNLSVDDQELFAHSEMDGAIDTPEELRLAFDWLSEKCATVPDWTIGDRFVLGNFWYAKLPMVKDLERSIETLAKHDIAAAFAGDAEARNALISQRGSSEKGVTAGDSLAAEFNVLDSDASQSTAIARARNGDSFVLKGPPGTGKSQTIANLICTAIGERKRILFVAEKRAAIEAVTKRLEGAGLSDLVLDLHQGAESRKWLAGQLGLSLERSRTTRAVDRAAEEAQMQRASAVLAEHVEALHREHAPWETSVFEAQQRVGTLGRPNVTARLRGPDLEAMTAAKFAEVSEALRDLLALDGLSLTSRESPWADAVVRSAAEAREAESLLQEVLVRLPVFEADVRKAVAETHLSQPEDLAQLDADAALWAKADECLSWFEPGLFDADLNTLVEALQPLQGSAVTRLVAAIGSSDYRAARKTVVEHLRSDDCPPADLFARLQNCQELQDTWTGSGGPAVPADLASITDGTSDLRSQLLRLGEIVGLDLSRLRFGDLGAVLAGFEADLGTVRTLPAIHEAKECLREAGLHQFQMELEADQTLLPTAPQELERIWWQSIVDHLLALPDSDALAAFRGARHDQVMGQFRDLDRQQVAAAAGKVRRVAAENAVAAQDEFPEQAQLVRDQARRKRGHLPVRDLFARAADVLTALRPCWVMSPLMVSQLIPSERAYFDIVVFDEASQVRPVEALTSIIRGNQVIVAGDERQLPPTTFFDATAHAEDEVTDPDGEETEIADYESLLDALMVLLDTEMLLWHYRSRDERLIGFSNREIYEGRLTTFPGAFDDDVVDHVHVDEPLLEGEERVSPPAEVRRVVGMVIDHARERPEETLGVIALGSPHADAIEAGLLAEVPNHPDLEPFFSEDVEERFFVKNLERVQGDERDAIILAVGYGKLPDGTLPHRFGPLNNQGGERRLNVAASRARRRMTVVSSFLADDVDPERSSARGVQMLRAFLAYAAEGGEVVSSALGDAPIPVPLHEHVAAALDKAGYECFRLLGVSADRIDLAVADPETGVPAIAIEFDGPAYAQRPSVRDRDRLRPEQLERLGWHHLLLWSQDWYRDPGEAARHLCEQIADALTNGGSAGWEGDATDQAGGVSSNGGTSRGPRPSLPRGGRPITAWREGDLAALARWIESDGLLRTTDELKRELMNEIGISRLGTRVDAALESAISRHRSQGP